MFLYPTNAAILHSWKMAHNIAGAAMLPPFGLTHGGDRPRSTRRTAASCTSGAHWPSPWSNRGPGCWAPCTASGTQRSSASSPMPALPPVAPVVDRLARDLNRIVLETWCHAVCGGENLARFELGQDDADAVRQLPASQFERWISLPIAIAVPRPGLIQALQRDDYLRLIAFTKPWEEDEDATSRHRRHRSAGLPCQSCSPTLGCCRCPRARRLGLYQLSGSRRTLSPPTPRPVATPSCASSPCACLAGACVTKTSATSARYPNTF